MYEPRDILFESSDEIVWTPVLNTMDPRRLKRYHRWERVTKPQLFLDLDGVLADMDTHLRKLFGYVNVNLEQDPPDLWDNVRRHGNFYKTQPLMKDALLLWEESIKIHGSPVILTGVPYSIPNVAEQKRDWVDRYFGKTTPMICCASRDKRKYGTPGDILVDDRLKYAHFWKEMGGVFVHHKSAIESISQLRTLYNVTL